MTVTERSVEIPFALNRLPKQGIVLDVGSNEATYLHQIPRDGLTLHCLDPRPADGNIPAGVAFFQESIITSTRPENFYDCVLAISTIEHIGLPHYDQPVLANGDQLALTAIHRLLRPDGYLVLTVPVGKSHNFGWFRQYSIRELRMMLAAYEIEELLTYGLSTAQNAYVEIGVKAVPSFTYQSSNGINRAGAVACVVARKRV